MRLEAWQVHDTGLLAAPGPLRRLRGAVRHHQGAGEPWPAHVVLELVDDRLLVTSAEGEEVGSWPAADVAVRRMAEGPPVSFVLQPPGAAHLLAAPSGPLVEALLAALER